MIFGSLLTASVCVVTQRMMASFPNKKEKKRPHFDVPNSPVKAEPFSLANTLIQLLVTCPKRNAKW